jgi:hypothetical protein
LIKISKSIKKTSFDEEDEGEEEHEEDSSVKKESLTQENQPPIDKERTATMSSNTSQISSTSATSATSSSIIGLLQTARNRIATSGKEIVSSLINPTSSSSGPPTPANTPNPALQTSPSPLQPSQPQSSRPVSESISAELRQEDETIPVNSNAERDVEISSEILAKQKSQSIDDDPKDQNESLSN